MDSPLSSGKDNKPSSLFPDTLWPLVHAAKASDPDKAFAAIGALCEMYRKPITNWLRYNGFKEDAEDKANEFILRWHIKNRLANFERQEDAKFRSYLLTCLRRFAKDEWTKLTALKRNKGVPPVPLEDQDVASETDLGSLLDRELAAAIHRRVLERLALRDSRRWGELQRFLFGLDSTVTYSQAGARLQMSEGAVKVAVMRLRESYFDAFRAEVAQIARVEELEEETRYLLGLTAGIA